MMENLARTSQLLSVVSEIINPKRLFMKSAYNALRDVSNLLLLPSLFLLAVSLLLLWHISSCTRGKLPE